MARQPCKHTIITVGQREKVTAVTFFCCPIVIMYHTWTKIGPMMPSPADLGPILANYRKLHGSTHCGGPFWPRNQRMSEKIMGVANPLVSLLLSGSSFHSGNAVCTFWYRQVSNIRRTLVGNKITDHSDVVGASPVGAAPTTSSFST